MPIDPTPGLVTSDVSREHPEFLLAAIVDSSFDAIVSKDMNSVVRSWNGAAERMFGYSADEAVGRSVTMLIPDNLQNEEVDIINRIKFGERVESFDTVRLRKDGTRIEVSLTISPIRNAKGAIIGASTIARDITQAIEAERRIRHLLREVNHRVKNQFAVILSIIRETTNRAASPQEFQVQLRDRIMALSLSHDLLVNSGWSGASLLELIHHHLGVFGHEQLVTIAGPLVTLNSNAVQHLGMAIHELGNNSARYGVLARGQGGISIIWSIDDDGKGNRTLDLTWHEVLEETMAEPLESSSRRGFGSVVVERVVPLALSGVATLERRAKGVTWSLRAPLVSMTQSE